MKTCFFAALLAAASAAVFGAQCDLTAIQSTLRSNATISAEMDSVETKCSDKTGINIFNITDFPTKTQVKAAQGSSACSALINILNGNANINTQCNITVDGVSITFGRLISDFLDGKTGNESASSSGSIEAPSESGSGESANSTNKTTAPTVKTSGSASPALSIVAVGSALAIAAALH